MSRQPSITATDRLAIAERYAHPTLDPAPTRWTEVFAAMDAKDGQIHVIEASKPRPGQATACRMALQARDAAAARFGGEQLALNEILQPGTGDMLPWMGYAGGLLSVVAYPSRAAWLAALLDPEYQRAHAARTAALDETILLVAGKDTMTAKVRRLLGAPKPPTAFRTPRIDGKSPARIVDDLLAVYPDGGADPSRAQLDRMMTDPRFRTEPVFYLNLYDYGDGSDPAIGGEAEHRAYNFSALNSVRGNGALPLFRAPVDHVLISTVPWDLAVLVRWPSMAVFTDLRLNPEYIKAQEHRVNSAAFYGNFMTYPVDPVAATAAALASVTAGTSSAARAILGAIGAVTIARGLFHWLAPDSGMGSVAGMNLANGQGDDVIFLGGTLGVAQLAAGVIDLAVAAKIPQAIPLALGVEAVKNGLVLATESTFKKPAKPVPGRFAHMAVGALALAGLLLATRRRPI
ncbi:MAG: hypothetical protein ACR2J8_01345 [Thermomicrobiales bacterium]